MLTKVKNSLRIDGDEHDDELQDLIDEAKSLLKEVGVHESKIKDTDPLIRKACVSYCKANFGIDDKRDKFEWSFEEMRKLLAMLSSYHVGDDV